MHKSITVDLYPEREAAATLQSVYGRDARPPSEGVGGNGGLPPLQYIYRGRDENVPDYELDENGNLVHTYSPSRSEIVRPEEPERPAVPQGAYDTTDLGPLPDPIENGTVEFLKAVFDEGDLVSVAAEVYTPDGGSIPRGGGDTISREILIERLENSSDPLGLWDGSRNGGVFVRVNAMMENGESDHEVANFKHALLEWDNIPLEQQWGLIEKSEIPCACVIYSGGNSIHAWVEVNAKDKQEFEERVLILHDHFKAYDPDVANKNPSRFSRLPGALRRSREDHNVGEVQSLLSLKCGARNWEEWMEFLKDADLPPSRPPSYFLAIDTDNDPSCLIGAKRYLCEAAGAMLVGQSGIGKSSLAMQQSICLAIGRPFFGARVVRPLRVAFIQAENDDGDLKEAMEGVADGLNLTLHERNLLEQNHLITSDTTSAGSQFIKRVERIIRRDRAEVVFCDPLVSYIGGDVSRQDCVSQFLRNGGLNDVITRTKVLFFWIHHTGKPPKGADRNFAMTSGDYSYIGLGSSDLTNWARAILVLVEAGWRTEQDGKMHKVYALHFPKRGQRAGFRDIDGEVQFEKIYLKHATGGRICWEYSGPPDTEEKGSGTPSREANCDHGQARQVTVTAERLNALISGFTNDGDDENVAVFRCVHALEAESPGIKCFEILERIEGCIHPIETRVEHLARHLIEAQGSTVDQAVHEATLQWDAGDHIGNRILDLLTIQAN